MAPSPPLTVGNIPTDGPKLAALLDEGVKEGEAEHERLERLGLAAACACVGWKGRGGAGEVGGSGAGEVSWGGEGRE